ncbi:MAG TPA: type II toxin-antitoxin system PemK/MazF family toxin [Opitutaceae bacterium]
MKQWDIVRVRIRPDDKHGHPALLISPDESCANTRHLYLNVLYGTSRRPVVSIRPHEAQLNGADGLERATLFDCAMIYVIDRRKVSTFIGRATPERRRQIGRKIVASLRLPLA